MNAWFIAFATTLAIELPIVFALAKPGERVTWLAVGVCANALTHPLAWLAVPWAGWSTSEISVLAVEIAAYRGALGAGWLRSCVTALVTNSASALFALA